MKDEKEIKEIRYFSMFTGVGGFELGLCDYTKSQSKNEQSKEGGEWSSNEQRTLLYDRQNSSFTCVGFSEIDKYASELLSKKFPSVKNYGDATKINPNELPDFDMLCGGFPCQAFSIAGKRRGFQDTRGTMFFEVARILEVKRPKLVFLENVKGLLNHEKGQTFSVILQTLEELGYRTQWMVLNSKFFGVPQNRERVFIIGSLRGEPRPEILPFRTNNSEVTQQYSSQVSNAITSRYFKQGNADTYVKRMDIQTGRDKEIYRFYSKDGISPALHLKTGGWQEPKIAIPVLTPDREEKRQNGRRFKEDGEPSFTLTGQDIHGVATYEEFKDGFLNGRINEDSIKLEEEKVAQPVQLVNKNRAEKPYDPHNREMKFKIRNDETSYTVKGATHEFMVKQNMKIRRLTPLECERLQGFPDGWTEGFSDTQRYKMMGNAVTVNVIKAIAERLL